MSSHALPTEEGGLLEFLRTVDTPTVANAIEILNVRPRGEGFPSVSLPAEKQDLLPDAVRQVLVKEKALLDFVRRLEFTSSSLRNRFLH